MKVISVVGARPQFVKATMVSRALAKLPNATEVLVHTGQHYDDNLSAIFFEQLEFQPDINLGVGSASHGQQTARMLIGLEEIVLEQKPDFVLVYGDTNSTLAGALAAVKHHIPVAHVEAGLRSFNRRMPEEINRVLTDHASDVLFAPTQLAVSNLMREGIPQNRIHLVGDVMYDAILFYRERANQKSDVLDRLNLEPGQYILATVHRAENTDNSSRLRAIFDGLGQVAETTPVVLPLHPRTRAALRADAESSPVSAKIRLIEPVGYLDMVMLGKSARLIATDSGGVQKEAYFNRVPCVTLREETEWTELVDLGWNCLITPSDSKTVADGITAFLNSGCRRKTSEGLFGSGNAATVIAKYLMRMSG